jgi:hypothetical protein
MKNLTFAYDSNSYIDFCGINRRGVTFVYISDVDCSLRPKASGEILSSTKQQSLDISTLIDRESSSLVFIDKSLCIDVPSRCYLHCDNLCYQSVRFDVDAGTRSLSYDLKVCSKDNPSVCIMVIGSRRGRDQYVSGEALAYDIHVPSGEYTAAFVDPNGNKVWSTYVDDKYETPNCRNDLGEGFITLDVPAVSVDDCKQLIRNGMVQSDGTISDPLWPWLHRTGLLELAKGQGIGGSNALKSNLEGKTYPMIVQNMDTRCFSRQKNQTIKLKGSIKLVDSSERPVACNPASETCPGIGFTADGIDIPIAIVAGDVDVDGYQVATARVTVGDDLPGA